MLYLLSFYMPRFQNQAFGEKLVTILHELWHISPEFNGDLRRFPGRCYAHSQSERQYDKAMAELAAKWLLRHPPQEMLGFLRLSYRQLARRTGHVYGVKIPAPKLVPLDE